MSASRGTQTRTAGAVEPRLPPVGGAIRSSCRLSPYLLLLVGSLAIETTADATLWCVQEDTWTQLDATFVAHPAPSAERNALVFVREPRIGSDLRSGVLVLRTEADEGVLESAPSERTFLDAVKLARRHLVGEDEGTRALLLASLLRGSANERRSRRRLSETLHQIREVVRKPLPRAVVDPAEPRTAQVDALWRLDARAFYIEGWVKHDGAELTSLVAMSPEGERVELVSTAYRYPRPDVAAFYLEDAQERTTRSGFVAFFELAYPSLLSNGWVLEMRDSDGGAIEVTMPLVIRDATAARTTILADLGLEAPEEERLKAHHIAPALEAIEARRRSGVAIEAVDQHGAPPAKAVASVIIPLFRRLEFLEQQLAQFVHDPELATSDLIYVLDSPEDAEYARRLARELHRLYGLPFRLVVLTANGGFSAVNNLGATLAHGRLLLLMNSDVLPERPGWLGQMIRFYDATPGIGALSPKLVYEDETIQHAGMYFHRPPGAHVWSNEHFFKGLHRSFREANVARQVPAVTGACLMIERELYERVGGLSSSYVQGDYEDSDLCLRLAEMGRKSWYLPTVTLYHLEGQSYPSTERQLVSEFNKWLHTSMWRDVLERVGATEGGAA
jgi:O-antigen biosynthesis protein